MRKGLLKVILMCLIIFSIFYFTYYSQVTYSFCSFLKSSYANCCKINEILIHNNTSIPEKDIKTTTGVHLNDSIFSISVKNIKSLLLKDNRIADATVLLSLDGILSIFIQEKIPQAILWHHEKKWFINENGDIIKEVNQGCDVDKYIVVFGSNINKQFYNLIQLIQKLNIYDSVRSVSFIGNRRWDVYLKSGQIVKLPEDNIDTALEITEALLRKLEINKEINIIDLRLFPNKIYIDLNKK